MNGLWELDKLTVLNLVDNETDGLSAACACCASGADSGVTYIQETRTALTRDQVLDLNRICCAAHGLSLLLIAERDGERRVCLFDAGPTPGTWKDNVEKLALEVPHQLQMPCPSRNLWKPLLNHTPGACSAEFHSGLP